MADDLNAQLRTFIAMHREPVESLAEEPAVTPQSIAAFLRHMQAQGEITSEEITLLVDDLKTSVYAYDHPGDLVLTPISITSEGGRESLATLIALLEEGQGPAGGAAPGTA